MKKPLLALLLSSPNVFAAGHMLPELGSLNASTAGAGSAALAESALTSWTNPAAMSELETTQLSTNLAALATDVKFTDYTDKQEVDRRIDAGSTAPIASLYFVTPINDKFHAGLAFASQGGTGIDYGDNFSGARLLQDVEFMTLQLMPSISYKVNQKLAIAASVNLEYLTANGTLDPIANIGSSVLDAEADDFTVGYSLSAFYKFNDKHRIGMLYRSEIDHYGEGHGEQSDGDLNLDVGLKFTMPQHLQMSGVHQVDRRWDMLWSVTWYDFSTWKDLTIDVNGNPIKIVDRNFDDIWTFAIGTHFQLNKQWRLESGVSYETSPQDDAQHQYIDLPVGSTRRLGLGFTYTVNPQWTLRGYYDYIDLDTPKIDYQGLVNISGQYDNSAHYVGLQVNYSFL
ncbi:OmpP1/FadL family transporter [Vibrio hippocampi]|uniref:47 kDa outer membrane protein n=1 Tax=Vibrio hippocampi TaxID=654686 RepID=A0ABM8ZHL0_9VIBR|nr:outer membrane protein transport protein [Vibrio hippocampi]CAH0526155.1 47 kDa outer membrane protein [Vibrio hippocampi]